MIEKANLLVKWSLVCCSIGCYQHLAVIVCTVAGWRGHTPASYSTTFCTHTHTLHHLDIWTKWKDLRPYNHSAFFDALCWLCGLLGRPNGRHSLSWIWTFYIGPQNQVQFIHWEKSKVPRSWHGYRKDKHDQHVQRIIVVLNTTGVIHIPGYISIHAIRCCL